MKIEFEYWQTLNRNISKRPICRVGVNEFSRSYVNIYLEKLYVKYLQVNASS